MLRSPEVCRPARGRCHRPPSRRRATGQVVRIASGLPTVPDSLWPWRKNRRRRSEEELREPPRRESAPSYFTMIAPSRYRYPYRYPAISHPGARRRVNSLWERDFCVKCDEAHFGARVLGPLGTRVPDSRASPDHFWDGGKRRTLGFPQEDQSIGDRKSTRLNSSHLGISYAVFCLKKKKKTTVTTATPYARTQSDPTRRACAHA